MTAGIYNMIIEQGATFEKTLTIKQANGNPVNLTGYTAAGKIRTKYKSPTSLIDFTMTFLDPRKDGKLKMSLTAAQTAALEARNNCVYDVEITLNGTVQRLIQGQVDIVPEATK